MLILYAGVGEILSSIRRISHPEPNDYSVWSLVIVAAEVLVKICMGRYTVRRGKALDSEALQASGKDAMTDSIASAATLAAALVYMGTGIGIEAYVGLFISCLIIKTGMETLHETVSSLLGEQVDAQLASAVKKSILSFPEVNGVFDLAIHNYGKEKLIGSAHIEIPDALTAAWVDNLQRAITSKVLADTGIEMLGITIYAVNSSDTETVAMRESIRKIAEENRTIRGVHGFYLDRVDKTISFDAEVDFDSIDRMAIRDSLIQRVQEQYPGYEIHLNIHHSIDG